MKLSIFFIGFIFVLSISHGQVRTNINSDIVITSNGKFNKNYNTKSPYIIPAQNISSLLEKEKAEFGTEGSGPFRFAEAIPVDINVVQEASWVEEEDYVHGIFKLIAAGAKSISVNFNQFKLPNKAELYVYNENGKMITGPITETENNENSFWGSWVYQGEKLIIELKARTQDRADIKLHVASVAYGYKDIYGAKVLSGNFGTSGSCNINVLCPAGNGWESQRNSIALIRAIKQLSLPY